MEREACVCDHGFERSNLCAEIIIIIILNLIPFAFTYITCKSTIDATSKLRLLPLKQFL